MMHGQAPTLVLFTVTFVPFFLIVGNLLRNQGRVFLEHILAADSSTVSAVNFLLSIGFYLLCAGLLLLNLGIPTNTTYSFEVVQGVAIRLGVSVIVVAALHSLNVLVLALLLRRKANG